MVTMSLNSAVKLIGLFTILNYTWTPPPPEQHGLSHTSAPAEHGLSHTSVPDHTACLCFPWLAGAKDQSSAAEGND